MFSSFWSWLIKFNNYRRWSYSKFRLIIDIFHHPHGSHLSTQCRLVLIKNVPIKLDQYFVIRLLDTFTTIFFNKDNRQDNKNSCNLSWGYWHNTVYIGRGLRAWSIHLISLYCLSVWTGSLDSSRWIFSILVDRCS